MYFHRMLVGAAASALLFPAMATADPIGDLNARLDKLEAENGKLEAENVELRARILKLEASGASEKQDKGPISALPPPATVATTAEAGRNKKDSPNDSRQSSWTGAYVSLGLGYGRSDLAGFYSLGGTTPTHDNPSGLLGGIGVGGDIQVRRFVFGAKVVGEYDNMTSHQSAVGASNAQLSCLTAPSSEYGSFGRKKITCDSSEGLTAEVDVRIGYTFFNDRLLTYVDGGVDMSRLAVSYTSIFSDSYYGPPPPYSAYRETLGGRQTLVGGVIGGGLEYRMNKMFSIGIEYEYRNFGENSHYNSATGQQIPFSPFNSSYGPEPQDRSDNLVRAYINVRPFN